MQEKELKIEYWPLEKCKPFQRNPKVHPMEQVRNLAASIKKYGWRQPLLVDFRNGEIIAGHGRYLGAKMAGITTVPVIDGSDMTDEQIREYRYLDNKLNESPWDLEICQADLPTLNFEGFNLDWGELPVLDPEVKDDNFKVELSTQPPVTQPGDVWFLGSHVVLCGDSTNPHDVERLMDGELADLLVTDPPYNVNYQGSNGKKIQNDNMAESEFRQFLLQAYCRAFDACRTGAAAYIFHADTEGEAFRAMFREAGWGLHSCLIWVKNSLVLGHSDYQWQHEPCLYGWKPGANHFFVNDRSLTTVIDDDRPEDIKKLTKAELQERYAKALEYLRREQTTVLRYDKPKANADHPTMKPVPLVGRLVKNSSHPGDIVLDLFGGSGSTLMACEQLGRRCFTMEYDPRYVDVIVNRWEAFTGNKAVRA